MRGTYATDDLFQTFPPLLLARKRIKLQKINGDKIVEYDFHSTDWNDRRKSSKWKDYPKYGSETKGYICLQEHGSTVSFRSIKMAPASRTIACSFGKMPTSRCGA